MYCICTLAYMQVHTISDGCFLLSVYTGMYTYIHVFFFKGIGVSLICENASDSTHIYFMFGLLLWQINHWRLVNAKSSIHMYNL